MDKGTTWKYTDGTMPGQILVKYLGKDKWEINYEQEGGVVRTIEVKGFDKMSYRVMEAVVEIGRSPQLVDET